MIMTAYASRLIIIGLGELLHERRIRGWMGCIEGLFHRVVSPHVSEMEMRCHETGGQNSVGSSLSVVILWEDKHHHGAFPKQILSL